MRGRRASKSRGLADDFARWVTTDHSGFSQAMANMPKMGFVDSLKYVAVHLLLLVLGAIGTGLMVYLLCWFFLS